MSSSRAYALWVKTLRRFLRVGAQVEGIKFARNGADWHPEGIQLAVPGNDNNVLLYNSLSLEEEEEGSLDGAHEDIVNLVAYDRSGVLRKPAKRAHSCTQLSPLVACETPPNVHLQFACENQINTLDLLNPLNTLHSPDVFSTPTGL